MLPLRQIKDAMKSLLLTFLFSQIFLFSYAQSSKIEGKVTHSKTGAGLTGVSVVLKNSNKGTSTDIEGHYIINVTSTEKVSLVFSYNGVSQQVDDIEVKSNVYDYPFWGNNVNRSKNRNTYLSLGLDLTSQISKNNLVKLGLSARLHDLEQDYYQLQFSQVNYRPVIPDKSSAYHTYYTAKPREFAAYVQDKIEFDELITNFSYAIGHIITLQPMLSVKCHYDSFFICIKFNACE